MRIYLRFVACVALVSCSGAGTSGVDGGSDAASDAAASETGSDATADSTNGDAGGCPDEHGLYSVTFSGQGCGTISSSAAICVTQTSCAITLATSGTGANELSGTTPIGADGSFSGAAIQEGTSSRTGCVGTWDNGGSMLTIDCGGTNTSQSCSAMLMRTAATCN